MGEEVGKRKDWERRQGKTADKREEEEEAFSFSSSFIFLNCGAPFRARHKCNVCYLTLPFPSVYSKGKSIWAQKEM